MTKRPELAHAMATGTQLICAIVAPLALRVATAKKKICVNLKAFRNALDLAWIHAARLALAYARPVSLANIARNVPQATFSIATVSASKIHVQYSRDTQFHALRAEITALATTMRATFQMALVPVELAGRRMRTIQIIVRAVRSFTLSPRLVTEKCSAAG